MLISPKTAIENGWIKRSDGSAIAPESIQPNAIDFTIDRVFTTVDADGVFKAADVRGDDSQLKTVKEFPKFVELIPTEDADGRYDRVPMFSLAARQSFDFLSDYYVEIPEGVAALLIVRSTFNRAGVFVTSGLYDSGYCGNIGAAIHNNGNTTAKVGKGVRVGQIMFVSSDSVGMYAGGYNTAAGQTWVEATQ